MHPMEDVNRSRAAARSGWADGSPLEQAATRIRSHRAITDNDIHSRPKMDRPFKIVSEYEPRGDQPKAIQELVQGLKRGEKHQTLLGITGSGKTYTAAC